MSWCICSNDAVWLYCRVNVIGKYGQGHEQVDPLKDQVFIKDW